ncbi:MAG: DUF2007 domain-containing protein [Acidobacteria bacterium]|nr:DUF2007 domain-containing protein [Acidobacteriota bacterium]
MRVYSAPILAQVAHVRHVLEAHGIECRIQGEYRSGAVGEIPPSEAWPELWVVDPADAVEAQRLVDEAIQGAETDAPGWTCSRCGEPNEGQFSACWKCGTDRPDDLQESAP